MADLDPLDELSLDSEAEAALAEEELLVAQEECGLNDDQIEALADEGFETLEDYGAVKEIDFRKMLTRLSTLPQGEAVRFGQVQISKLLAVRAWVTDCLRRERKCRGFNHSTMVKYLDINSLDQADEEDDKKITCSKFKNADSWVDWELEFINLLQSSYGVKKTPLSYVVRKDKTAQEIRAMDEQQRLIYEVPLTGEAFVRDDKRVYCILKSKVLLTPAWEWMKEVEAQPSGKRAMELLRNHFDGSDQVKKRIINARATIEKIHYKSESQMPFETFLTKLKHWKMLGNICQDDLKCLPCSARYLPPTTI
jgi:hypothetical protein